MGKDESLKLVRNPSIVEVGIFLVLPHREPLNLGSMFKFSMQTALDVRGKQEKIKMKEMAVALAVQQALQSELDEIDQAVNTSIEQVNQDKHQATFSVDQFRFMDQFKQKKRLERGRVVAKHKEAAHETEQRRLGLVEAAKNRKTLEILRDREMDRFQAKQVKFEREFADEVASNQFVQQHR